MESKYGGDFRFTAADGLEMIGDAKTEADRDPYTIDYDTLKWKLRYEFSMSQAVFSPRAMLGVMSYVRPELTADGLESLGRYREAAERRCETFVRLCHRELRWHWLWLAIKWGFLSGWRRDRDRAYLVGAGVMVIENIGAGR